MLVAVKNKKIAYVLLIIFSLGTAAYFSFKGLTRYAEMRRKQQALERQRAAWRSLEEGIKKELGRFDGKAGIVVKDLGTGWQILINQDKPFPSASLVKIPIMLACFYAADEGKLKLDERLKLKAHHKVPGSAALKDTPGAREFIPHLRAGAGFTVKKLVELMIAESDNAATNMLVERLGFDYLNNCFKKLGLKDTNISRKMLDFKKRKEGEENFTTASDLAFLLEEIYNRRLINKRYSVMCLEFLKKQKMRDRIPARLPADTVVAHKTGLENNVCHDVGIVFTPKGNFLICVLTEHKNKTARLAKELIAQVALLTHSYYQRL